MTAAPVHPSLIPRIPTRYTATITTHDGWWYRYRVDRLHGVFIPETTLSMHHTLAGAERAAARWTRRNHRQPERIIQEHGR